jgi:hypothetical protein
MGAPETARQKLPPAGTSRSALPFISAQSVDIESIFFTEWMALPLLM